MCTKAAAAAADQMIRVDCRPPPSIHQVIIIINMISAAASTLDLHPSEPVAWVTSNCAQLAVANGFFVIISNNNNITNNKVTDLVLMHFSSYSEWWL